jgi:acyl-CoA thioesterase I
MRLCFIGDSFVNGTGDDEAMGWAGRVFSAARRNGLDATYYNLGVRRQTSADIAARWRAEVDARHAPESALRLAFSFGTNDGASDERGGARVRQATTRDNAGRILQAASLMGPTIMLGPAPVLDDVAIDERVRRISDDLKSLCGDIGVPFLETFAFVNACAAWRREALQGDGTHPNREGYAALAKFVWEWPEFQKWITRDP